jgi:hypothetical protein
MSFNIKCPLAILDNTFVGTLSAGILLGIIGLGIYNWQKKTDLRYEDLRKDRELAASLYASVISASEKMEGLFNLYDGKNPVLTKLSKSALADIAADKIHDELTISVKDINANTENFITKMKIKNVYNIDINAITNSVSMFNFYLNAAITLQKLNEVEIARYKNSLNDARGIIESELMKILNS